MIVDGHCDTLSVVLDKKIMIDNLNLNFNLVDINKINENIIQMMAIYISPEFDNIKNDEAWVRTKKIINKFYEQKIIFKDKIFQIFNKTDINKVYYKNQLGVILTIENGSAICGKLNRIKKLHNLGVRVMSITWNEDNELGCGAHTIEDKGLTELGKKYIKELNNNNIIIDISHSSEKTFWDTVSISSNAIVATHSCVYNLCPNNRNLKDNQIKEIAKKNGVIGICFCSEFLNSRKKACSEDIVDHIKYIKNLVGIDYVGLGSDFDGVDKNNMLIDIKGIRDINLIKVKMKNRGFSESEIQKVMGGNWIRVLKENI